jgi:hypothetical protein
MPLQVVQFVRQLFEFFSCIVLAGMQNQHVFIVKSNHLNQLGFIGDFVSLGLIFLLRILISQFLQFEPLSCNL